RPAAAVRRMPALWPRRAMMIAVWLTGSVLLAATIIWALGRSGPREVPVIEADSRPFRVRPEGITPTPPPPAATGTAARPAETRLAPTAETPRPDMLRQPPAPAPAAATPPAAAAAQPRQGTAPAPATPAPATTAAPANTPGQPRTANAPATPPAATPPAATRPAGRAQVQLAAVGSEEAARAEWDRLRRRHPELASLTPRFQRVEREGQSPVWRVRASGVADAEAARSLCAAIRQRGGGCNPA
ncbi:MAG: SPOR domain-containing protein, partial [Alphaproteobacteria bacterium]|nr:SPOR domain-containing protein [Alphaproteobacteria bacterium]